MKISTKLFALATVLIGLSAVSCSKTPDTPVSPKIDIDEKTVSFAAAGEEKSVKFETNMDWTITVPADATWATVTPTSGKSGKATVAVKVLKNDGAERTAELTITAGTKSEKITIKQAAAAELPAGALLFPGANFEDEDAFKKAINSYGLVKYATIEDGGKDGKGLKVLLTSPQKGNDRIFTAKLPNESSLKGKKAISFYIKGTSTMSICLNVLHKEKYEYNGKQHYKYETYNLGTNQGDSDVVTLSPTEYDNDGKGKNSYKGTIDTKNKWIKVVLRLPEGTEKLQNKEGEDFFTLRIGSKDKNAKFDIMVDEFMVH